MKSTLDNWLFRRSMRGWIAAACGMVVLVLIGAAKVHGEGPAAAAADAKLLDVAPTIELLQDNLPVPTADEDLSDAITAAMSQVPSESALEDSDSELVGARRVLWMEVTAYCPCEKCCGKGAMGLTASGKRVSYNDGAFVAADTDVLPFGTKLMIPGYSDNNPVVEVIDRGGAIKGHKLDVFYADHDTAMDWGRQWIPVTVVE
jgi:3D (Asp-Asp-Asp) domain-containing protein